MAALYTLYHSTLRAAIKEVEDYLAIDNLQIDPEIYWFTFANKPAPEPGIYNRYDPPLVRLGGKHRNGQFVHIQVYGMESGNYELNFYTSRGK